MTHYWRDIWRYRELFYILAWRDLAVRYRQTAIGVAWALIRPLSTTLVLVIVFNKVARFSAPGSIPYVLLVLAGMLPWQLFSTAISESANSLVGNAALISKVYFPRLLVPAGSVVTSLIDFLITLVLTAVFMVWYGFLPGPRVFALPVFVALALGLALGTGVWLSALNVRFRDFRHMAPLFLQLALYISPVGFTSDSIPQSWRLLYAFNPVVGIIDGFRWSLLPVDFDLWWPSVAISGVLTIGLCFSGIWHFRRVERTFVDVI